MLTPLDRSRINTLNDIESQIRALEAEQAKLELPLVERVLADNTKEHMEELHSLLPPGVGKFRLGSALRNMNRMKGSKFDPTLTARPQSAFDPVA